MFDKLKIKLYNLLRKSEKYTKTDMVYLAKGGFWLGLGYVVASVSGLLLAIAFANLLPKETYGIYKYILSIAGILGVISLRGMGMATTQAVARGFEGTLKSVFFTKLKWSILLFLSAIAMSGYYFMNENNTLAISILIIGLFAPLLNSAQIYQAFLNGKKDFKTLTKYNSIINITYIASMLITIFLTKNIILIILAYFATNTALTLFFYFKTFLTFKPNKKEDPKTIPYGKKLSLLNILGILLNFDKIMLFHFWGAAPLAVYAIANAIPAQINSFSKSFLNIALPKLSKRSISEIKNVFYKKIFQSLMIGTALTLFYIPLSPFVFKWFLPQYFDSILYSQILGLSFIFVVPITFIGSVFHSQKLIRLIYTASIFSSAVRLILYISFSIFGGIMGLVVAHVLGYAFAFFFNIAMWQYKIKHNC